MLTTIPPFRFHNDLGADHYKSAASEGWGNLLDHPAPAEHSDFFRPNPNGDGTTQYRTGQGFMDYTDDSCIGFAAERNRLRVSDGTSNTLQCSE